MKSSTKGTKRGRADTDDSDSSSEECVETDNDNTEDEDTSTHDNLIEQKHQQKPLHATGKSKTIFGVLDGGNPNASLAIFQVLLEELKLIPAYFQDARIMLDMQELEMHLHGCSQNTARVRINRLQREAQNVLLSKYRVPGSRGTGKVVMELRHVLEYVLAQKGVVAATLRRSLIEIACRATAGDQDLFRAVSAWKQTMDPKIRAMLMSGYVRSEAAMTEDPVPEPEDVAEAKPEECKISTSRPPPPSQQQPRLTFLEAEQELLEARVSTEILASPFGAQIVVEMRENGLLSALECVQKCMTIYLEWATTTSKNNRETLQSQARILKEKEESVARIAREDKIASEESAAKIKKDNEESAAKIKKDNEESAAKIKNDQAELDRLASESQAAIKLNAARMRLEESEKKLELATKMRIDNALVDIEETKAWQMREEVFMKKKESDAKIRREDLNSVLLRKQQRKTEASIPISLVSSTAVDFFHDNMFRRCHGLEVTCDGVVTSSKCADKRTVTAFRYDCVAKDDADGKMIEDSARIVCPTCSLDAGWHRHQTVQDPRNRRRTWLYANGSNVRGMCVGCDGGQGRFIHVADGEWQCCHDVPSAIGGSKSPDHGNIHPGHSKCNVQQGDIRLEEFRERCGLAAKQKPNGFERFKQKLFDALDTQLASAKPKSDVIQACLLKLNKRTSAFFSR
jgi:hypothetical protein